MRISAVTVLVFESSNVQCESGAKYLKALLRASHEFRKRFVHIEASNHPKRRPSCSEVDNHVPQNVTNPFSCETTISSGLCVGVRAKTKLKFLVHFTHVCCLRRNRREKRHNEKPHVKFKFYSSKVVIYSGVGIASATIAVTVI